MPNFTENWRISFLNKLKELKAALYLFGDKSTFIYSILSSYMSTVGFSSNFQNLNSNKINMIIDEAIATLENNPNSKGLLLGYLNKNELGIISIDLISGNFSNHNFLPISDSHSELDLKLREFNKNTEQDILWKSSHILSTL